MQCNKVVAIVEKMFSNETYRNGIKTGKVERPFFRHFDDVPLERDFMVAVSGVLWRDAIVLQHL